MAPALNTRMVSTTENLRDVPAAKFCGTRELRLFEQTRRPETLGNSASGVTHCAITKAGDRLGHDAGGYLSPAENNITNTDLAIDEMLSNAVVHTLVASTEQAEAIDCGQLLGHGLIKGSPAWAEKKQWAWRVRGLHGLEDRLGLHHHARTSPERGIVDRTMDIAGLIAYVVAAKIEDPSPPSLAEQALGAESIDETWKQ